MSVTKELRAKLEAAKCLRYRFPHADRCSCGCCVGDRAADAAHEALTAALPALLAVVEAALERDGCSEVCSAMKPYRGCTCGAEALDRALASLTRNDEVG